MSCRRGRSVWPAKSATSNIIRTSADPIGGNPRLVLRWNNRLVHDRIFLAGLPAQRLCKLPDLPSNDAQVKLTHKITAENLNQFKNQLRSELSKTFCTEVIGLGQAKQMA